MAHFWNGQCLLARKRSINEPVDIDAIVDAFILSERVERAQVVRDANEFKIQETLDIKYDFDQHWDQGHSEPDQSF